MPFEPGKPKTGGRKTGTPNKRNLAIAACEKVGCDPFAILADFAMNCTDKKLRYDAAKELAQYFAPKLRATEHSTNDEKGFVVRVVRYGEEDKGSSG